jgi:hypothetical protein
MVSWKAPRERVSDFFSAVARMESSDLIRQFAKKFPLGWQARAVALTPPVHGGA